mgnify:CR=1 FL=1
MILVGLLVEGAGLDGGVQVVWIVVGVIARMRSCRAVRVRHCSAVREREAPGKRIYRCSI